jgi:hypothetical protein
MDLHCLHPVPGRGGASQRLAGRQGRLQTPLRGVPGRVLRGLGGLGAVRVGRGLNSMIVFWIRQAVPGGIIPVTCLTALCRVVPKAQIGTAMGLYGLTWSSRSCWLLQHCWPCSCGTAPLLRTAPIAAPSPSGEAMTTAAHSSSEHPTVRAAASTVADAGSVDHRERSRRRGEMLCSAILEATLEELREVGYAGLRMQRVAARAAPARDRSTGAGLAGQNWLPTRSSRSSMTS